MALAVNGLMKLNSTLMLRHSVQAWVGAFIRFLPLLQVAYVKAQLNPIPKVLEEIYNYDIFLFQRKELICQLDFNIDFPWYADSCNMSQNTVVCPYVKDALVNAHFPRFPVSASASAVHSVAARRLHHRYPELLCRKRYRTGHSYSELLRSILYFGAQVVKLLRILSRKFYSCCVHQL